MRFSPIVVFYALLMSLLVSACSDDAPMPLGDDTPLIEAGEEAQRLLLMYIAADNNLDSYAQLDLYEALQAAHKVPNDCYMLAFVDDGNNGRILRYFKNAIKNIESSLFGNDKVMKRLSEMIVSTGVPKTTLK